MFRLALVGYTSGDSKVYIARTLGCGEARVLELTFNVFLLGYSWISCILQYFLVGLEHNQQENLYTNVTTKTCN